MKVQAVIFDLDGTLYPRCSMLPKVVLRNLSHLRLLYGERSCRRATAGLKVEGEGALEDRFFEILSLKSGVSPDVVRNWYNNIYMPSQVDALRSVNPYAWVRPVLGTLRDEGKKTALYSDYGCASGKLEALGISPDLFDVVTDSFALGAFKPCGDPFMTIAGLLGADPDKTVVVGDRFDTDGRGAYAAGMFYLNPKGR